MMKTRKLSFLLLIPAIFIWSCSSSQYASQSEYDDLYFTASDRGSAKFTSINFNESSSFQNDAKPYKITGEEELVDENFSAKTINPEYIAKYQSDQIDNNSEAEQSDEYGEEDYYTEEYDQGESKSVVNNYYYGRSRSFYYDPFYYPSYRYSYYDPYFDPFYDPYYYRSGINFSISFGYGFGFSRWNRARYWSPVYGYRPSYLYSAFYCPGPGYYYGSSYGYYDAFYYVPRYGTSVIYNSNVVTVGDNINRNARKIWNIMRRPCGWIRVTLIFTCTL